MTAFVEARDLGYRIGPAVLLEHVDLRAERGELLAIGGPNGAGKSTLLKLLAGDLDPTEGEVLVDGRPLRAYRARELARRRSVLPQQTVLQFAFTAAEVVELGRSPFRGRFGGPNPDDRRAVEKALARVEASPFAERSFPTLSAGEQARVSLARVLAQEAELVLLDEPTAALDLRHQELVMSLASALAEEGHAVVAVIHDLNLAARHADRVALLGDGRLAAHGAPWDVLTEETILDVFEHPVHVLSHPDVDRPVLIGAGSQPSSRQYPTPQTLRT
jgi:iron complex transport system ATP-binding protein